MRGLVVRSLVAACVVVSSGLSAPASSAAVSPSPCTELSLSPTFSTDGTAVCGGVVLDPGTGAATAPAVFVTTDKGHSWRKASANGIAITRPDDYVGGVSLSPRYSVDHMIFVQLARAGLFVSVDRGETFTLVSPLGLGQITPYVATPGGLTDVARPLLLHADASGNDVSMQIDPSSHAVAPVPGTPGGDREFAVSPRYATDGLAFAAAAVASADRTYSSPAVFACAAGFACTDQRFLGPPRSTFERLWVLPSTTPSGFVVAVVVLVGSTPKVWWSVDGGSTFQPWASVDAIVARMAPHPAQIAVVADPSVPRRMYLRASWVSVNGDPPDEQIFTSNDAGAHWSRVSYGTWIGPRHVGPMPAIEPGEGRWIPGGFIAAGGNGRLFLLAGGRHHPGYSGPYCSRDGGKTWNRFC